ncbi:MAG TPA: AAA family ATPase [Solirubrobacteraceae bacterium]|nr:AAA family ATPase [Solirubrobacteraceae bacterium]
MRVTLPCVVRLLEREDELGLLTGVVGGAVGGRGCLVLVGGEAGIGKTSLVRAMRASLPGGVAFVSAACEPLSVPVPLASLRELLHASGRDDVAAVGADDHVALARSVLRVLVDQAPVVAVVEDAHWADPLTLDVLRVAARRVEEVGVVVVVTYRDDEVGANPPLGLLLGDLTTSPAVRRLALGPLSGAAVEELVGGSGLDADRLRGFTGGNPFLVVESIAVGGRLPASVRDAALARAGRLSLRARRVVDAAAVAGQRIEPVVLHSLVGECSEAVDEALARGVLVAEGTALGFRHELIRDALEQSISPTRRAELHARVCAALAEQPDRADNALLAHHAELGGLADKAAAYAKLAAAEAERVGAVRETYLQADRALRLGRGLDQVARFDLLVQYARAANFANPRLEEGVDAAQRAVRLADELGDDRRRGRALLVLSYTWWSLERVVEARTAAEQAIAALQPSEDTASLAWAYATLIRIEATSFDPVAAIAAARRAREFAERGGLEEVNIDLAISVGLARGHLGDREALEALDGALRAARDGGFTIRMVRTYVNLMTVAVALREHRRADQVAGEGLPLLEELGVSQLPRMAIRFYRARSLLDRGRWDDALAITGLRERWWQGEFSVGCATEGLVRARRGEPGAEGLLEQAWSELTELVAAESARHGMVRLWRVEAAWLCGDRAAASQQLREARDSPAVVRFARSGGELALWGSRLGVELEVPAGASAPVLLELEGDWRRAIAAWLELEAPYEAALAALPGDDRAAREAMTTLHKLGAKAAAQAFARDRAALGARAARGARRSTLANPAGLTRREQEVLEALETGASNAEIATALHLSERTVAHHVSAILAKFGVRNRHAAIEQARRRALLSGPSAR